MKSKSRASIIGTMISHAALAAVPAALFEPLVAVQSPHRGQQHEREHLD